MLAAWEGLNLAELAKPHRGIPRQRRGNIEGKKKSREALRIEEGKRNVMKRNESKGNRQRNQPAAFPGNPPANRRRLAASRGDQPRIPRGTPGDSVEFDQSIGKSPASAAFQYFVTIIF